MKTTLSLTILSLASAIILTTTLGIAADPIPLNIPPAPEAQSTPPQPGALPELPIPSRPLPADSSAPTNVEDAPAVEANSPQQVAAVRRLLDQGQVEEAIRMASQGILSDPTNAPAYKQVRANAYWTMGRYAEALADHQPLPAVVEAQMAEIKSGKVLLKEVPRGTSLNVSAIKGGWLRVVTLAGEPMDWAWIRVRDIQKQMPTNPPPVPQTQLLPTEDPVGGSGATKQHIPPMPIPEDQYGHTVPLPQGGYYYEARPIHPYDYYRTRDYGRRYYDYWRHVPSRYWRYLP